MLLTEYRGLSVAQLQRLRRALGANAEYKVAKNTLATIGAKQAGIEVSMTSSRTDRSRLCDR